MKASKTLTSALTAMAVAGAIGIAYAQAIDPATQQPMPTDASTMQNQGQGTTDVPSTAATTTDATATDTTAFQGERPAQADRN